MEYHAKRVHRRHFRTDIFLWLAAMLLADVLLILYTTETIVPKDFLHFGVVTAMSGLLLGGVIFSGARLAKRHKH